MYRLSRTLRDTGDTIVEVLICTAIVSLILSAAFNSTRDSLMQFQQAQERGEATKLVEQQAERLRAASLLTTSRSSGIFSPAGSGNFCMNSDLTINPAACQAGIGNRYEVTLTRPATNTFEIHIRWDRIGGGNEELRSAYRLYPPRI